LATTFGIPPELIQYIFMGSTIYTVLMIPISMIFLWALTSNIEAWTFFKARFAKGKTIIIEGSDDGYITTRLEETIGMGVLEGKTNLNYSMITRDVASQVESKEPVDFNQLYNTMVEEAELNDEQVPKDAILQLAEQVNAYNQALESRGFTQDVADSFVNNLNKYRYVTRSSKVPLLIRYSGKAIATSIAIASASSNIDLIAQRLNVNIRNLKNAFTKMITPSQVMHIAFLNQLIGAKRLGKGMNMGYVALALILVTVGVVIVYYMYAGGQAV